MTKKEVIWRYLVNQAISHYKLEFQQKNLAKSFGFSLSTVNNALIIPRETGAIKVGGRNFLIEDKEKFLYLWATHRKLNKEIIYSTRVEGAVDVIENQMPAEIIYGSYSAYRKKFKDAPADYDKVYVYASSRILPEIKARFPIKRGYKNLFVLKSDEYLKQMSLNGICPEEQMFVDIWNLTDWYAKDFLNELKSKIL